jgi:hypothetical protein
MEGIYFSHELTLMGTDFIATEFTEIIEVFYHRFFDTDLH